MTFLQQVADYYIRKAQKGEADLGQYTFVFPNKRSAMYMRKHLRTHFNRPGFMPKLVSITSFTQKMCPTPIAKRTELLFLLYTSYCKVLEAERAASQPDFDSFIYWGNVLLDDFNDIDSYLVNPVDIFENLYRLKEIDANYLTEDQIEVARLLGDKRDRTSHPDAFWNHLPKKDTDASGRFVSFWQIMGKLYNQFRKDLASAGLAYSGLQSKLAWEQFDENSIGTSRFAFIGFYVLPTSRMLLFKKLKSLGRAEFFWDTASPLLKVKGNDAGDIVFKLAEALPSPTDFSLETIRIEQDITIYPVTSRGAQAKACSKLLDQWQSDKSNKVEASDYGIVLPSETMLMPLLHSISPNFFPLNVAMKVSLDATPLASLIQAVLVMMDRARIVRRTLHYFYEDVIEILSNPYIAEQYPDSAKVIKERVSTEHLFNISYGDLHVWAPELDFVFAPPTDFNDFVSVKNYLLGLIDALYSFVSERDMLLAYRQAAEETCEMAEKYGVKMKERTYFTLMRRFMACCEMHISTNPVWGLQIMSLLDARLLDFHSLAILGVNEGILPPKNFKPSLVPSSLRHAFMMPTPDDDAKVLAYQFYRVISRAQRLAIFYDSRTPDLSKGEKSRFVSQLELIFGPKIKTIETDLGLEVSTDRQLSVEKTPYVLSELERLRPGKGTLNFSASAFKTFIKCKLKFYLQYVKGLRVDDRAPDFMDSASYGSVVHRVAELYYAELQNSAQASFITPGHIAKTLENKATLEKYLRQIALRAMCECYYGDRYLSDLESIPGEGRVLASIIAKYIIVALGCESEEGNANSEPFRFLHGEYNGGSKTHAWEIGEGQCINFTMSIDRIDQLESPAGSLRFIDYKTGDDHLKADTFDDIFSNHKNGGIFQLILYALAYADLTGDHESRIKPLIYRFMDMSTEGIPTLKIGDVEIDDYKQEMECEDGKCIPLSDLFRSRMLEIVNDIFNPDTMFDQTQDRDNCTYCPFTTLCGRLPKDKD